MMITNINERTGSRICVKDRQSRPVIGGLSGGGGARPRAMTEQQEVKLVG